MKLETQEKINRCIDTVETAWVFGCIIFTVAYVIYGICF